MGKEKWLGFLSFNLESRIYAAKIMKTEGNPLLEQNDSPQAELTTVTSRSPGEVDIIGRGDFPDICKTLGADLTNGSINTDESDCGEAVKDLRHRANFKREIGSGMPYQAEDLTLHHYHEGLRKMASGENPSLEEIYALQAVVRLQIELNEKKIAELQQSLNGDSPSTARDTLLVLEKDQTNLLPLKTAFTTS